MDTMSFVPTSYFFLFFLSVCQFLGQCQGPNGGFGGGPSQQPHLAPTYAAVNALCTIGTEEAYNVINRYVDEMNLLSQKDQEYWGVFFLLCYIS